MAAKFAEARLSRSASVRRWDRGTAGSGVVKRVRTNRQHLLVFVLSYLWSNWKLFVSSNRTIR